MVYANFVVVYGESVKTTSYILNRVNKQETLDLLNIGLDVKQICPTERYGAVKHMC